MMFEVKVHNNNMHFTIIFTVRKAAILNSAPLPPSRQRNSRFNNYRSGPTTMEPQATNLMRQTLKMAKNR